MVKKLKKMAEQQAASPAGLLDSHLAGAVKASAQQIWLAGMGAFAKAQEEGGKVFEALVKEGVSLQRKTQAATEERIGDVTGKMSAMAEEVSSKAGASWDKLESIFETRTAKAMSKLGVPTAKDVAALTERLDALAAAVASLGGEVGGQPAKGRAARAAAGKSAAKPAARSPAKPATQTAGSTPAKQAPVARKARAAKTATPVSATATPANGAAKPAAKRAAARKAAA